MLILCFTDAPGIFFIKFLFIFLGLFIYKIHGYPCQNNKDSKRNNCRNIFRFIFRKIQKWHHRSFTPFTNQYSKVLMYDKGAYNSPDCRYRDIFHNDCTSFTNLLLLSALSWAVFTAKSNDVVSYVSFANLPYFWHNGIKEVIDHGRSKYW